MCIFGIFFKERFLNTLFRVFLRFLSHFGGPSGRQFGSTFRVFFWFGYVWHQRVSMDMQKWTSGKLEKWKNRNCKYGKLVMWEFGKMQKCKCGQVGQTDRQTSLCPSLCLSQLSTFALFRNPTFPILHFSTFPLFQFSTC